MINPDTFVWPDPEFQIRSRESIWKDRYRDPNLANVLIHYGWIEPSDKGKYQYAYLGLLSLVYGETEDAKSILTSKFFKILDEDHWVFSDWDVNLRKIREDPRYTGGDHYVSGEQLANDYKAFVDWTMKIDGKI